MKAYLHWTSRSMLAFMGMARVTCLATQMMVALWWPRRTLRWAPLRTGELAGTIVRLSGGCSGPSSVAWDRLMPQARTGAGLPPSAAHSSVSSEPSFTGTNWLPGSSRRPSISRYVPLGASVTHSSQFHHYFASTRHANIDRLDIFKLRIGYNYRSLQVN